MIAIVDYGMGNLRSVEKALQRVGGAVTVTSQAHTILQAEGVILPGVGAFGDAMDNLRQRRLLAPLEQHIASGKPFLGICLGLHLLFEEGQEMGRHRGLGVLAGYVRRFPESDLKVPHIGWNQLHIRRQSPLLEGVGSGSYAYFVHSYYVVPAEASVVVATTDYGIDYASAVEHGNLLGVQFHPEKSQDVGLRILGNFVNIVQGKSHSAPVEDVNHDSTAGD
jgi:glutamine amidotransferase